MNDNEYREHEGDDYIGLFDVPIIKRRWAPTIIACAVIVVALLGAGLTLI